MRKFLVLAALAAAAFAPPPAAAAGFCTAQWAPVCGTKDGGQKTYSNAGCAKADGAEVVGQGPCPEPTPKPAKPPIFCAEVYHPVCAIKDGVRKTYSTDCFAKADGAKIVSDGECP